MLFGFREIAGLQVTIRFGAVKLRSIVDVCSCGAAHAIDHFIAPNKPNISLRSPSSKVRFEGSLRKHHSGFESIGKVGERL